MRLPIVASLLALLACACGDTGPGQGSASAKRRESIETPERPVTYSRETVPPTPQVIVRLPAEEVRSLQADAERVAAFVEAYEPGTLQGRQWTLKDLDEAFEAWVSVRAPTDSDYGSKTVVRVLGAAFGEYCVRQLDMEWVRVSDADGIDLAVRGRQNDVIGFPFAMVEKRVESKQFGFFLPVFRMLEHDTRAAKSNPH